MVNLVKDFWNGVWDENTIFKLQIGMCPTLAVSTSAQNGLAMGLATTFVLVCSSALVSLVRKLVPNEVRIPVYVVIIATFVTVVDLFLKAAFPDIHAVLGIFIPLIVVNCVILARAEAFAGKMPVHRSAADALGFGIGFMIALVTLGSIREILGMGTWFGMRVMPAGYVPWSIMVLPPGAFITLGFVVAAVNLISRRSTATSRSS
ncbi:MAG: electron transport complex subunit E [Firmicutes bacterium]|nr:electron transport complex subunit E [Bacillota bacterium]